MFLIEITDSFPAGFVTSLLLVGPQPSTSGTSGDYTVKTLNIGTPRLATVVVLNIKQFNFTMK